MADYDEGYAEERYGALGGQMILEKENDHYREILEGLGAEEGDRILELGSNNALLSEYLSQWYEMHSADVERNPLFDARENNRSEAQYQVDAHRLPFQEDSFDYVLMPRMLHLDVINEPEVIQEASRIAEDGIAFDVFSRGSFRVHNPVMHLINDDMPKSNLRSNAEIRGYGPLDGWLEEENVENIESFSDFAVPFGAFKKSDKEAYVNAVEKINEAFESWGRSRIPDPNSVIYTSVEFEDEF